MLHSDTEFPILHTYLQALLLILIAQAHLFLLDILFLQTNIHLSNNVPYYVICAKDSEVAAILNVGEEVFITYEAGDGEILKGITLER